MSVYLVAAKKIHHGSHLLSICAVGTSVGIKRGVLERNLYFDREGEDRALASEWDRFKRMAKRPRILAVSQPTLCRHVKGTSLDNHGACIAVCFP